MNPLQYISTNCTDIVNSKVVNMEVTNGVNSVNTPVLENNEYIGTVKNTAVVGNDISVEFSISSDNYKNIKIKYIFEVIKSIIDISTLGITDATLLAVYEPSKVQHPTINTGEHNLVEGTDYEIELLTDGIYAGTQRYKVKGIGKYDGEIELSFTIKKKGLVSLGKVTLDDTVIDSNKNPAIIKLVISNFYSVHELSSAFTSIPSSYSNVIGEYFTFPEESGVYNYLIAKKTFTVDEMLISFKEAGFNMIPSINDLNSYSGVRYPIGDHIPSEKYTFSKFATVDWDSTKMSTSGFVYNVEDIPYDGNPHNFDDVELIESFAYSGTNKFVQNGKVTGLKKGIDYTIGGIYQDSTKVDNAILPGSYRIYYTLNFGPEYNTSALFNITKGVHEDVFIVNNETEIGNWPDPCNMTMKVLAVSSMSVMGGKKGDFTFDVNNVRYGGTNSGTSLQNMASSVAYNEASDMITYVISGNKSTLTGVNGALFIPVTSDLYNEFKAKIKVKIVSNP